jgi:hypothetical protein
MAWFVTEIGAFVPTGIPDTLDGIDFVKCPVFGGLKSDIVKYEKFCFRSDISDVPDTSTL